MDQNLPRGNWHLGRIVRVIHGKDGLGGTVEVKTRSSATHTETLSVRGIREPLPWLRLFRIKNRTLTLFLSVINPINRFFWELMPNLLALNASLSFAWGGVLRLGSLFFLFPAILDHVMSFVVVRSYSMYQLERFTRSNDVFNAWQRIYPCLYGLLGLVRRIYTLGCTDWFVLFK